MLLVNGAFFFLNFIRYHNFTKYEYNANKKYSNEKKVCENYQRTHTDMF